MAKRSFLLRCLGPACVLLLGVASSGARGADQHDWWDPHWQYRLTVEVPAADWRGGINTALLNLAEQSQLCLPDGRDVRVLRPDGQPAAHRVSVRDNKTLDVLFEAAGDATRFRIYYGNAEAEKAEATWQGSLGGLFLETRPIDQPIWRPQDVFSAARRYTAKFGSKPWSQIADFGNPFGRDDLYLGIYTGTIYCPEDGAYVFAVNADDMAVFSIEEVSSPLCWRGPGGPSTTWNDPANPTALRKVRVRKGVYHLVDHHVENYGAQLAKLGWQTPSSDSIFTVPPEAFVQYLPTDVVSREVRGQALCPFFVTKHLYNVQVNGLAPGFPVYHFESRMGDSHAAEGADYRWDFGDGATASGPVADHEFGRAESHEVTLALKAADGTEAAVKRLVAAPAQPVKDMTLQLQAQSDSPLIGMGAPLQLRITAVAGGTVKHDLELVTTAVETNGAEKTEQTTSRALTLGPRPGAVVPARDRTVPQEGGEEAWAETQETYPAVSGDVQIAIRAMFHGMDVAAEHVAVLRTDGPLAGLHLDNAQNLRDQSGCLVVLRLAETVERKAPPRRLCETNTGTVSILAFDQMLGGPPGQFGHGEYGSVLAALLSARYPELSFTWQRATGEGEAEALPMQAFLHVYQAMGRARANLVLLVCQPQSVINGVPLDEFEKCLSASLDQVLARSRAEVVVVTPPPAPGNPEAARPYAYAAKRVGLRKGVAVVDLYSRFVLTDGWENLFRPLPGREPSFLLYPNEQGQGEVAQEICATLVEEFHDDLSAAARKVSLLRASGGP